MSLTAGTRIGVYEVTGRIGAGGMGEVYRARDTRLGRDVALKVLADRYADDVELLARLEREARTLATLNHPHVAGIHGIEESGGVRALVMELVEGEDLAARIGRQRLAANEALRIAADIAAALEAAHELGIVHRDLKPANIKLRDDGTVKVLDFGLAKAMGRGAGELGSAVVTRADVTEEGTIVGTAAYMSPEQATAGQVDRRTDVWSFGCVLYEMLTGQRAFAGATSSLTLRAVLAAEPDWARLPADTPPLVRRLLRRCLHKDPRQRQGDMRDARLDLDEALAGSDALSGVVAPARWSRPMAAALVVVSAGLVVAALMWPRAADGPPPVVRFSYELPIGPPISVGRPLSISQDGDAVVFASLAGIFVRPLASLETTEVPRSEAGAAFNPVFSPDGASIAYWAPEDGTVRRIPRSGGASVRLGSADSSAGLSWDASGIVTTDGDFIVRLATDGGPAERLLPIGDNESVVAPQLLPDGRTVLYTLVDQVHARQHSGQIVVQAIGSSDRRVVVEGGTDARYLASGHLVYADGGTLMVVPFDARSMRATSEALRVTEGVGRSLATRGIARYAVSDSGTLAYMPGSPLGVPMDLGVGFQENDGVELLGVPPGPYETPRMSPDGEHVVMVRDDAVEAALWVYDLGGGGAMRRLTVQGHNRFPVWSADGRRVIFQSDREGDEAIFWQPADGSGPAERLTTPQAGASHIPESASPSGEHLLFTERNRREAHLQVLSLLDGSVSGFADVRSVVTAPSASFSPDGRWVAYSVADASWMFNTVYVQPFPATGAVYPISEEEDGHHAVWSRDGKRLIFIPGPGRLYEVDVTTEPRFAISPPRPVPFRGMMGPAILARNIDTTSTPGRLLGLFSTSAPGSRNERINVVVNWLEEVRGRAGTR